MNIQEKAAYLKGLADGMELDPTDKTTKLFNGILDLLGDMAFIIDDIDETLAEMDEEVDEIDQDLGELEEEVYVCDDDCCDHDHDNKLWNSLWDDEEDEDWDDGDLFEIDCPACGTTVLFDASIFDEDEIECPECGAVLEGIFLDEEDIDDEDDEEDK